MKKITIYTTKTCPYCVRAKALFNQKKVTYEEIDVSDDAALRQEMMDKANGRRTVPQIFIDSQHIGGCDDLYELDKQGKLDKLLNT